MTTIRGIPETKAALEKVRVAIELAAPNAARAGGEVVVRAAASRAPRDTGRTASSMRADVESFGQGATAHVGPTTTYARFTEFGTVYIGGQHYMSNAAEAAQGEVAAAMAAIFKAAI